MKNFFIVLLIGGLLIAAFSFQSCNKHYDNSYKNNTSKIDSIFTKNDFISSELIKSQLYEYHLELSKKNIWGKIKKWIKAHTGTNLFNNCIGHSPCGPCPGLCLLSAPFTQVVPENYVLSTDEINNGERIFILNEYQDSIMVITFIDNQDFIYEDNFYLPENYDLGQNVASAFNLNKLILKKGVYPVIYNNNPNGETIVNVIKN